MHHRTREHLDDMGDAAVTRAFVRFWLAVLLLAVVAAGAALAHGDAIWIEKDKSYKDPNGTHCCGVDDCSRLPDASVERLPGGGWRYKPSGQVFQFDDKGVYPSIDRDFWGCVYQQGQPALRCFFAPLRGV